MTRLSIRLLILAFLVTPVTFPVDLLAQDDAPSQKKEKKGKKSQKKKKADAAPADPLLAAMMEANKLGKEHEELQKSVGTWDIDCKFTMMPGQPPLETKGVSKIKSILGGRYLQEDFRCKFMGMPYHGMGTIAYDNLKKKYVTTWKDNMSTGIFLAEGTLDPKTGKVTYLGEKLEPGRDQPTTTKMIHEVVNENKHIFHAYNITPEGEYLTMELVYNRRVKGDKADKGEGAKKKGKKKSDG